MSKTAWRAPSAAWRVFRAPLLLAVLTAIGLAAALLGEAAWRWFSWVALAMPVALCLWYPLLAARSRAG